MGTIEYSKGYEDLHYQELRLFGKSQGLDEAEFPKVKDELIELIVTVCPDFDKYEYADALYYFRQTDDGTHKTIALINADTIDDKAAFTKHSARVNNRNRYCDYPPSRPSSITSENKENINDLINELRQRFVQDETMINNFTNIITQITDKQRSGNKFVNYKLKLEFDEVRGVESFISSVEAYVQAYNIPDKKEWIKVALAALNNTDYGLTVKESLGQEELDNWQMFKNKLVQLLGKSREYYVAEFRNFKRKSAESPGLTLARLTMVYKKAHKQESDDLNTTDHDILKSTFIHSLEPTLQVLVSAEESKLNYSNIAERTAQLERCYKLNSTTTVNAIQSQPENSKSENDQVKQVIDAFQKQLEVQNDFMRKQQESHMEFVEKILKSYTPKPNYKRGPKLNVEEFKGFCVNKVLHDTCKFGPECRFKHSNIPTQVADLKQKYNSLKN